MSFNELIEEIKLVIKNCKQISPSIFYLRNFTLHQNYNYLLEFLSAELDKLTNNDIVLAIIDCDDKSKLVSLKGYKKFNTVFDFYHLSEESKSQVYHSLKSSHDEDFLNQLLYKDNLPYGQLITRLEEGKLNED